MSSYSCKKSRFCWSFSMTHQKDNINSVGLIYKSLNCIKNDLKTENAPSFLSQDAKSDGHFSKCQQMAQAVCEHSLCHCVLPASPANRRLIPTVETAPRLGNAAQSCCVCFRTKLLSHLG